jgi:hypothetical protein
MDEEPTWKSRKRGDVEIWRFGHLRVGDLRD